MVGSTTCGIARHDSVCYAGLKKHGLLGDVATLGDGVFEMREFFGPGWRMYYVQQGQVLIVMLGGGDKSSQAADIAEAKALAATLTED